MRERTCRKYLNDFTSIIIYIKTEKKEVVDFVVILEYLDNTEWIQVERYDCSHGFAHRDILNKKGDLIRKIQYKFVDYNSALDFAINDYEENYQVYIWRFINA